MSMRQRRASTQFPGTSFDDNVPAAWEKDWAQRVGIQYVTYDFWASHSSESGVRVINTLAFSVLCVAMMLLQSVFNGLKWASCLLCVIVIFSLPVFVYFTKRHVQSLLTHISLCGWSDAAHRLSTADVVQRVHMCSLHALRTLEAPNVPGLSHSGIGDFYKHVLLPAGILGLCVSTPVRHVVVLSCCC